MSTLSTQPAQVKIIARAFDGAGDIVITADDDQVSIWSESADGRPPEGVTFSAATATAIAAWLNAAAHRTGGQTAH